jgi:hypothetical protein
MIATTRRTPMDDQEMPRDRPNEEEKIQRAIQITQHFLSELETAGMGEDPSYKTAQGWVADWRKTLAALRTLAAIRSKRS